MKFLFLSMLFFCQMATAQNQVLGKWSTEDNKAVVQIYTLGGKYYGKILSLKTPLDKYGKAKVDSENPDKTKRNNPRIGLIFLTNFVWDASDNEWDDGSIYDPETGKSYSSKMWLSTNNTLKLRGYWGPFYKTQVWTRVN
jgi:uncharacterized protein (DUF2147 family)